MPRCPDCNEYIDDRWVKTHRDNCKVISLRGLVRYKPFKYWLMIFIPLNILFLYLYLIGW